MPIYRILGNIAFLSLQTFITLSKDEDKVSTFMAQPASVKYAHTHKHVAECPKLNEHTRIYPSPHVNTQAIGVLWRHIWFRVDAFYNILFTKSGTKFPFREDSAVLPSMGKSVLRPFGALLWCRKQQKQIKTYSYHSLSNYFCVWVFQNGIATGCCVWKTSSWM